MKKYFIILMLIPTFLLANTDPISDMKAIRDSVKAKYLEYRELQYKTSMQEHYLKHLSDIANVAQLLLAKTQDKYQLYTELYNEWKRIELDNSMNLEEKALLYASLKSSFLSLSGESKRMVSRSKHLKEVALKACHPEEVKVVADRYDPHAFFKIPRYHFSASAPPHFDTSILFEVNMSIEGDVSIPSSSAHGMLNDPKLSEDQQAAAAVGAAVVTFIWCGGISVITMGTASAWACSPVVTQAIFYGAAAILAGIFQLANQHNAINEYAEKMDELKGLYDETNQQIDSAHAKLAVDYVQKFEKTCQEIFVDRKPDEGTLEEYLVSIEDSIASANNQIQAGTKKFLDDYDNFKNNYASWLDNEINVLGKLQSRLDQMYSQSLTQYYQNLVAVDQASREFFMTEVLPAVTYLKSIPDKDSAAWVNNADNLLSKYVEGDLTFDASAQFQSLPWKSFQKVIEKSLEVQP